MTKPENENKRKYVEDAAIDTYDVLKCRQETVLKPEKHNKENTARSDIHLIQWLTWILFYFIDNALSVTNQILIVSNISIDEATLRILVLCVSRFLRNVTYGRTDARMDGRTNRHSDEPIFTEKKNAEKRTISAVTLTIYLKSQNSFHATNQFLSIYHVCSQPRLGQHLMSLTSCQPKLYVNLSICEAFLAQFWFNNYSQSAASLTIPFKTSTVTTHKYFRHDVYTSNKIITTSCHIVDTKNN